MSFNCNRLCNVHTYTHLFTHTLVLNCCCRPMAGSPLHLLQAVSLLFLCTPASPSSLSIHKGVGSNNHEINCGIIRTSEWLNKCSQARGECMSRRKEGKSRPGHFQHHEIFLLFLIADETWCSPLQQSNT